MHKSFRIIALKIISLTAVFCLLYIGITGIRMLAFHQEPKLPETVYYYALLIGGFISGLVIVGDRKGRILALIVILTGIIPAAASCALYINRGLLNAAFEIFMSVLIYFIGFRAFYTPFTLILSNRKTVIGAVMIFLCMAVTFYFPAFVSARSYILLFSYVFLAAVLLTRNQSGIDEAFIKRHIDRAIIPGNMRRYNTSLVMGMFLVITVLINIRVIVSAIAGGIRFVLLKGIIAIYWIFMMISELFKQESTESPPGGPQNLLPNMGDETGNSIVPIILSIIMGILGIFILYLIIKKVPGMMRALVSKLKNTASKLYAYLQALTKIYGDAPEDADDYEDEVETIRIREGEDKKFSNKQIRFVGKNLKNIKDPVQRIRCMYSIILYKLKMRNIRIVKSDTTGEILDKSKEIQGIELPLSYVTRIYEKTRYGERVPDEAEIRSSETNFKTIDSLLGAGKNNL